MSVAFELLVPFTARGRTGVISVSVSTNTDPSVLGCDPAAEGFPACRATVEYQAEGYEALLGWVQLVGIATGGVEGRLFAIDPLAIFEGLDTPFAFYGLKPVLFDGPSRRDRDQSLDWLAHSFLCFSPSEPISRRVVAAIGFSWGFVLERRTIEIAEPRVLQADAWSRHLPLLRDRFRTWTFEGVAMAPPE